MLRTLMATIKMKECLPIPSIINYGTCIPKKIKSLSNPREATDTVRTIHMYNAFTQNFMKTLESRCYRQRPVPSHCAFGAIAHRRREEAVLIQMLNSSKCAEYGLSSITKLYDVRNAFYGVAHDDMEEWYEETADPFARVAYQQIVEHQLTLLPCADSFLLVSSGSGVPPGFTASTSIFNRTYQKALNK